MKTRPTNRFLFSPPALLLAMMAALQTTCPVRCQTPAPPTADRIEGRIMSESNFRGGLTVQAGLRDPALLLSMAKLPNVLAQALVREPNALEGIRNRIREAGLYGRVSAVPWSGTALPYADNTVNLLLVLDEGVRLDQAEINRVLAPSGTAWLQQGDALTLRTKPRPDDVDEWSHNRYDATGNAVSRDKHVGPPRFLQWEALPRWNRGVKTSNLITTHGRIFYILDDSHFASTSRTWSVFARDAANGVRLWRRELPSWEGARGGKKVGPAQVNRRLVADADRVYVTMGEFAPISVLDAATGETLRVLEETEPTEEFIVAGGILVALVNPNLPGKVRRGTGKEMRLVGVAPATGSVLWEHAAPMVMPLTVACDGVQVVYHDGAAIKSLDARTGSPRWTSPPTGQKIEFRDQANADSPGAGKLTILLAPQFAPTLVMYQGVVAFAGGCQINVVSAEDGTELWKTEYSASNYSTPVDVFGFGGYLWGPDANLNFWRPANDNVGLNAYDLQTGEIKKRVAGSYGFRFQHHRCHQMKVVDGTLLASRAGIEFLDTVTGSLVAHHWVRGSCYYGVMPANGLLYVPPTDCACYIRAKLSGFMALASEPSKRPSRVPDAQRLQRGPAYGQTKAAAAPPAAGDWPTYRHDAGRSGGTDTAVGPEALLLGWQTQLPGTLTSPVMAENRVYIASTDSHTLHALDALTGSILWRHMFDARVDSPPTAYDGLVLTGCRDGSVTALRAVDGAVVWRFTGAPAERVIVSRGQLESTWPVHGSVLVVNGTAYFAAGRSSYLDGGLRLYGLEPHTGRTVVDTVLETRHPDGSEFLDDQAVDGFLNDILSSNGDRLFMRHQVVDLAGDRKTERIPHLHGPDGYLSGDTTSRLLWTYAPMYTTPHQGAFYDLRLSRALFPSGRILVEDDETIYGFGQNHYVKMRTDPGGQWALFSAAKDNGVPLDLTAIEYRKLAMSGKKSVHFNWSRRVSAHVRAMVKAGDTLFAAGPRGGGTTSQAALDGKADATLLTVSPTDGDLLGEVSLPATPVWDGMIAAGGNLYLALANGQVLCIWPSASGRSGKPLTSAGWGVELPKLEIAEEPGLLGRWRFDEGVGLLARDCSGRGHDADVSGRWAEGDSGICLMAEGTPQAVVIPDAPHLHFGNNDFALAFWVKIDGHGTRLLGKEAFPENWWVINILDNGRAELVLGEGRGEGRTVRPTTTKPLATDAWTHLVAVADRKAGEVRWYVNGEFDSREAIPKTMTDGIHGGGHDISIPSSHKPFRGLIGDLRIYGQALTPERIQELFKEQSARRASTMFRSRD